LGLWKDKIVYVAPDFNAPLEDFAEYMRALRKFCFGGYQFVKILYRLITNVL